MANGTVSNWNDPAITRDNGGKSVTGGRAQKICGNLDYTPLSEAILTAAKNAALKDPGDGKGPCVK